MHSQAISPIESLRKPISRAASAIVIAVLLLTIPRGFETNIGEVMEVSGFGFLILAALGRVWCSIYISGRKDKVLCVDGPYHLCRNPLYFFSLLGVIGVSLSFQSLSLLLVSSLCFLVYYYFVIRSEESRLESIFGSSYVAYRESTPRFFPALRSVSRIDSYLVSPIIIERALKEVVWFLFVILAVEVIEVIHAKGYLVVVTLPF